jgi:hypothetical protein
MAGQQLGARHCGRQRPRCARERQQTKDDLKKHFAHKTSVE